MVDSTPDMVTINCENSPPVADAGPDLPFSTAGDTIQLDGTPRHCQSPPQIYQRQSSGSFLTFIEIML
jgi:hypothetical protein